MKCDLCDKDATVHEWTKKVEKHLCEECARKQGVAQPQQQMSQILTQLIAGAKPGGQQAALNPTIQVGACGSCGTTYAQFRHSGLLGCPNCYQVFETQLGPLLQRAHEGGTHHTGKVPQLHGRVAEAVAQRLKVQHEAVEAARVDKIKRLREQLTEAVAAEQYEKAATIRDELSALDASGGRTPSPPAGAGGNAGGSASGGGAGGGSGGGGGMSGGEHPSA